MTKFHSPCRLYYTKLHLGSPPKQYYVQIDTGSDVLWVSCSSCKGCPKSSGLQVCYSPFLIINLIFEYDFYIIFSDQQIPIQLYDPSTSSTASLISCSDQRCLLGTQSSDSSCSGSNNQCSYTFHYGDGSGTSGYYVSDLIHLETIVGNSIPSNASASIVFG